MNKNQYYIDTEIKINEYILEEKFDEALKVINEELSMPYVPMDFEKFLLNAIERVPIGNINDSFSLSLEKIIDLLLKLDKTKTDLSDLIDQLKKFNLKKEKDELEYYFHKSENKRNRAMIFELLIEEKADIECELGNPSKSISVKESENYKADLDKIKDKLMKYPVLQEPGIKLLNEIYLTKHYNQVLNKYYSDMVIFTLARLFEQQELLDLVDNFDELKKNLENFKNFESFE